jgi:O-Antigen ligase
MILSLIKQPIVTTLLGIIIALAPGAGFTLLGLLTLSKKLPYRDTRWLILGFSLFLLPAIIHKQANVFLEDIGQVLLFLFIFLTAMTLPKGLLQPLMRGLSLGLTCLALVSLLDYIHVPSERVFGWRQHPNIWGMQIAGITLLILTLNPPKVWLLASTLSAVIVIVLSGSRTAMVSFLLGFAMLVIPSTMRERRQAFKLILMMSGIFIVSLFIPSWKQRLTGTLFWLQQPTIQEINLFASSEQLDDMWQNQKVKLTLASKNYPTIWRIEKLSDEPWARLQQQVILFPRQTYTLSGELRSLTTNAAIGFWGSGKTPQSEDTELRIFIENTILRTKQNGKLQILSYHKEVLSYDWIRFVVSFQYNGPSTLRWWLGPTPNQHLGPGILEVKALQFQKGTYPTFYESTQPPNLASSNLISRFPAFQVAWSGFLEKPWLGQGVNTFYIYYYNHPPSPNTFISSHAHNLFLQTLFERGFLGIVGILIIFSSLLLYSRTFSFFAIVFCVLVSNIMDYTLWSASSFYVIAAAYGWHKTTTR